MTNKERLKATTRTVIAGMMDLLSSSLCFESYENLTKKQWNEAASALRSMCEAVDLLYVIVEADGEVECDLDELPPFRNEAINSYSASFGNRCFFQRNEIKNWLSTKGDECAGDFRFDLDFDVVETTETQTTKTKKTTRRKRTNAVSVDELVEKK